MVYYGKGFTWTELYNMPVWLRKFYFKKIEDAIITENKKNEKASKSSKKKIDSPGIAPKK